MYAHLSAPVPSARSVVPEVPEELDELARRAMAKDPGDRFTTAGEMAEALNETLPTRPTRPAGPLEVSEEVALQAETAEELSPAERTAEPETAETGGVALDRRGTEPESPPRGAPVRRRTEPESPPPRAPSRRRTALLAAIGGGAAAIAVVLVLALSGGGEENGEPTPASEPAASGRAEGEALPPLDPRVLRGQVVDIGAGADGAAAGGGFVWIANRRTNEVIRVAADGADRSGSPSGRSPTASRSARRLGLGDQHRGRQRKPHRPRGGRARR